MRSRGAGGYDFASAADTTDPGSVLWTANALPSVIALTELPAELASPTLSLQSLPVDADIIADGNEHVIEIRGERFRIHVDERNSRSLAVVIPFDELIAVRVTAILRLWYALSGRQLGPSPDMPSTSRKTRLILALRAIDGRADNASYREIATVLFGAPHMSGREWKSHDVRDRTIRLVRFGLGMTRSGYRLLLHYPHRGRSRQPDMSRAR